MPPFVVKIPVSNSYRTVEIESDKRVIDLLQQAVNAFGITLSPSIHLKLSEATDPLPNSKPLSELKLKRDGILVLGIRSDAPVVQIFPFFSQDKINKIIRGLKDFTPTDQKGRNLLHLAAEFSTPGLKSLLKKKVLDVNAVDSSGNTPIHYASYSHDIQRVELLLAAGASIRSVNAGGMNCLHLACSKQVAVAQKSFEKLLDLFASYDLHPFNRNAEGASPAHLAVASSNVLAIQFFIEKQFFLIDFPNGDGDTCLHLAVRARNTYMVSKLIEFKASKYVRNNAGELPLDIANKNNDQQIATLLNGDLPTRLINVVWDVIKKNDIETAKQVNIKYRDREMGATYASSYASQKTSSSKLLQLTQTTRAAKDSSTDIYENVPYVKILNLAIHWACARAHLEILDYLLDEAGANPKYPDSEGSGALYILCRHSSLAVTRNPMYAQIIRKCISRGSVNDKTPTANTALHIASLFNNTEAVKVLLENNAFINSINHDGLSELHYAVLGKSYATINELIHAGSDPLIALRNGVNGHQFARKFGDDQIVDILSKENVSSRSLAGLFQPNIAVITIQSGAGLLAKDDNGLSDPYCFLKHRYADLQFEKKTQVKKETLSPVWNEQFKVVIKQDLIFYRDIIIDCYDWDEGDSITVNLADDFIGSGALILNVATKEENAVQTELLELQSQVGKSGVITLKIEYKQVDDAEVKQILSEYTQFNVLDKVSKLLKETTQRSVGSAKAAFGFRPKYPIMIIPGLASSALECWASSDKPGWIRDRVWIDPFKIGKTARFQKLSNAVTKRKKSTKKIERSDVDDENGEGEVQPVSADDRRLWLRHLLTADDGFSDPPGIKLRPVPGLNGIDFLATNPLARKPSYVFGHVLPELYNVGYTPLNLDAAPYDWRLPPEKLEERDRYFTILSVRLELMKQVNNEKVVMMGHSMGNRCIQYFLAWAKKEKGQQWIDDTIHAFFALGPPFLGAPKTVRAGVSGDCMGLDVFLTQEEGRTMARGSGSLPWLFPIQEHFFPDTVTHVREGGYKDASSSNNTSKSVLRSTGSSGKKVAEDVYKEMSSLEIIKLCAPGPFGFWERFYKSNSFYWNNFEPSENTEKLPPIVEPPPITNLWVVYGVNLDTEVSYYFQPHKSIPDRYILDTNSDKYSGKKISGINPTGLRIAGGIGYETKLTFQPLARTNKSGDGTVPYCSLNYCSVWKEYAAEHNLPYCQNVQIVEIEGADHREMLAHPAVFDAIINFVCTKPQS